MMEATGASTLSSWVKHSDSTGRRQEVKGGNVLGLSPWRCKWDSASAGVGVLLAIEPVHGKLVLSVVVMLRSSAPDVLMTTVEKFLRILSLSVRSAFRPETLSLSFERVGRQDSHTTNTPGWSKTDISVETDGMWVMPRNRSPGPSSPHE